MASEGIGRGKDYQRKLHLLDRRKIVNPRDIEGMPMLFSAGTNEYGSETHEVLRAIQRELGTQESFVSATLTGSHARGHSVADSDIDVTVVFDTSKARNGGKRLMQIYRDEMQKLRERGVLKKHVHEIFLGVTPDTIRNLLNTEPLYTPNTEGAYNLDQAGLMRGIVVAICGLAVGPRVEEYRTMIAQFIRSMPPEKALHTLQSLAVAAMEFESNSEGKRSERIPILKTRNQKKTDTARIGMWYTRIVKRLGLNEPPKDV